MFRFYVVVSFLRGGASAVVDDNEPRTIPRTESLSENIYVDSAYTLSGIGNQ